MTKAWLGLGGLLAFTLLGVSPCRAQEGFDPAQAPIVLEAHSGWNDPMGMGGLALVYDPGRRFSGGLGFGLGKSGGLGLFGRMAVLRADWFSLGLAATLSEGDYRTYRTSYSPTGETTNKMAWTWNPGYRATAALAAQVASSHWSLRLEGGLAYLLNDPTCQYVDPTSTYQGSCDSSLIPAPYRFSTQPGRVIPSVTASLGFRFGVKDPTPPRAVASPGTVMGARVAATEYRSPGTAQSWSLGLSLGTVSLATILFAGGVESALVGVAVAGIGLGIAPSAGHFYAGETARGWTTAGLRLVVFAVGGFLAVDGVISQMVEYPQTSAADAKVQAGVGLTFVAAGLGLAIYDIVDAPRAARRSNARQGLTDLGLAPLIPTSAPGSSRGVALQGRF